jgi:mannitol-1-phosphate/altronate dehydrogenase
MSDLAYEEICPDIKLSANEARAFAANTLERFHNPYIRHQWRKIALNSVPKWQTRVLPSLVDFHKRTKSRPQRMVFSLAALIVYYRGVFNNMSYQLEDDEELSSLFSGQRGVVLTAANRLAIHCPEKFWPTPLFDEWTLQVFRASLIRLPATSPIYTGWGCPMRLIALPDRT